MNGLFKKHHKIQIAGLKSKPQWNGIEGTIIDDYNFKKERWPILIDEPINKYVLIKSINLKPIQLN